MPDSRFDIQIDRGHGRSTRGETTRVVIDVIRAFTVADIAFRRGAVSILLVADTRRALALRQEDPRLLLAGEEGGLPIKDFDLGNSPWQMSGAGVAGRRLVQRTSHGVQALLANRDAELLLATGVSQAASTAAYLRNHFGNGAAVDLIASHPSSDEDLACADYLKRLLDDAKDRDLTVTLERIRRSEAAAKFLDPTRPEFDPRDLDLCCEPSPTPFAMQAYPWGEESALLQRQDF